jgi:hypothetical protein
MVKRITGWSFSSALLPYKIISVILIFSSKNSIHGKEYLNYGLDETEIYFFEKAINWGYLYVFDGISSKDGF